MDQTPESSEVSTPITTAVKKLQKLANTNTEGVIGEYSYETTRGSTFVDVWTSLMLPKEKVEESPVIRLFGSFLAHKTAQNDPLRKEIVSFCRSFDYLRLELNQRPTTRPFHQSPGGPMRNRVSR